MGTNGGITWSIGHRASDSTDRSETDRVVASEFVVGSVRERDMGARREKEKH